jgi:hypothetical protein
LLKNEKIIWWGGKRLMLDLGPFSEIRISSRSKQHCESWKKAFGIDLWGIGFFGMYNFETFYAVPLKFIMAALSLS